MKKNLHPKWPDPPVGLSQRLLHVLDIFEGEDDDAIAITATAGVYAPHGQSHSWTGLTYGDLRALADLATGWTSDIAEYDRSCQFAYTGDEQNPRRCTRCGTPQSEYAGGDCPEAVL